MKKLTAGLIIAALIIVSAMPVFAFDENKIITLKTILRYWVDIDSDESRRCTQCV